MTGLDFGTGNRSLNKSGQLTFIATLADGRVVAARADPVVPEPSTVTLFGLGSLGLLGYGWRRRQQASQLPCGPASG